MFAKFLDQYVMAKDKDPMKKFNRTLESNVVEVTFPTLFPLSCKELDFMFLSSDSKANQNKEQI